jgi:trk system potassium uptake protein TrkA
VRLFSFRGGHANLVEMTLPDVSPRVGTRVADLNLPGDAVLVTIIRDGAARAPERDSALESNDELLFVCDPGNEGELAQYLVPRSVRAGEIG